MSERIPYAGRPRQRKTRRSVRIAEVFSRALITVGGIGTIVAVVMVFAFLVYVVLPLFQSASVVSENHVAAWDKAAPLHMGVDEDQTVAWGLFGDGRLDFVDLQTGKLLNRQKVFEGPPLTAWSFAASSPSAVFGFADGSIRTGTIKVATRYLDPEQLPKEALTLAVNQSIPFEKGVLTRTVQGQFRVSELEADVKPPVKGVTPSPVLLLAQTKTTTGDVVATLNAAGKLRLNTVAEKENLLTGETTFTLSGTDLPYAESPGQGPPSFLFVSAVGDQVFLFWKNGRMVRYDARDRSDPKVAERRTVFEAAHLGVTAIRPLIGKGTFLIGDTSGRVRAWFYTNDADPTTTDHGKMVCGHEFPATGSAVTALAVSERTRMAAAAYADQAVRLFYVTSERVMAELHLPRQGAVQALTLAPKDDGVLAVSGGIYLWKIDPKHPEINARSLFSKVWYEGYEDKQYMWQSSGGTDAFEPKYSLIPLIFGTLKASFYSLIFGVPIALFAAIYTSEFLRPKTKALVKPTIELMASLPSVVLGFLAGLVFAQFVENVVPTVLACMVTVPVSLLLGAYLWQLLPQKVSLVLAKGKFAFICLVLPVGGLAAIPVGAVLEWALFGGNLRSWLDGRAGNVVGGWIFLVGPMCAIITFAVSARFVNPWLRTRTASAGRGMAGALQLLKFLVLCSFTVVFAWGIGWYLGAAGIDPRGFLLGPYSQRNALVVGFVMGFAIIPIIYTIAEDALSAVPDHLRAGSLAAGATRWQTAVRIVIPTAMSGLFSAVMIGLGRAVGETMIVLMATGNTPVMDWSVFSGFRTLSANIAVELPEAVRDSTHYRTLFLAALTLFAITFILNTIAEFIRLRFRRRAYQL
jgi:phosphate transport system permease protein